MISFVAKLDIINENSKHFTKNAYNLSFIRVFKLSFF